MSLLTTAALAFLLTIVTARALMPIAHRVDLVDKPGGHKVHEHHTPLVGGLAMFAGLVAAAAIAATLDISAISPAFVAASALLIAVGVVDDKRHLKVTTRFVFQGVAVLIMVYWGGVRLVDFGHLLSGDLFQLGLLAVPMTVFATVGTINAMNMADGLDGLAGTLALITVALLGVAALANGGGAYLPVLVVMAAALAGFLVFNLRLGWRHRASIFMGDAGSTFLGFALTWLFVATSQGEGRIITPVTALWIFAVPLYDTIGVMVRRAWMGKSPVKADRGHLHHLLSDAGCAPHRVVLAMAGMQLGMGAIGLYGLFRGVPEHLMFYGFLALFAVYAYLVARPWRLVPRLAALRRLLGLPAANANSVFVGGLSRVISQVQVRELIKGDPAVQGYRIYRKTSDGASRVYAVLETENPDIAKRLVKRLQPRAPKLGALEIRPYMPRGGPEAGAGDAIAAAQGERRSPVKELMVAVQ